jgi:hypothetical protein
VQVIAVLSIGNTVTDPTMANEPTRVG